MLSAASALAKTPDLPCLTGDHATQLVQAQLILDDVTKVEKLARGPHLPPETNLTDIYDSEQLPDFYIQLSLAVTKRGCAISTRARLDTIGEVLDALTEHTFQIPINPAVPQWLVPGFKAVLAGYDSNNTIFIETTLDGFKFHACEKEDGKPDSFAAPPSEDCPALLNDSIMIPVDQMLKKSSGVKHALLSTLNVLIGLSVIVTSSLGLQFISPAAIVAMTLLNPTPQADIQRDFRVAQANRDLLNMGSKSARLDDNQIVTRLLPYKYVDLRQAQVDLFGEVFKSEYKQLNRMHKHIRHPNIQSLQSLKMELDFHTRVQEMYEKVQADKKAGVVPPKPKDD